MNWLIVGAGLLVFAVSLVARRNCPTGPRYVLALGDSITASGEWAAVLQKLLPAGSAVQIAGYGGMSSDYIADRFDEITASGARFTDVVVLAGVNNITNAVPGLERIYRRAKSTDARLVAVQITPWAGYSTYNRAATYNTRTWIANNRYADVVIDTTALGDNSDRLLPGYSRDGLHPSAAGQATLAGEIYRQGFGCRIF